jgi:hypothetical protein
MKKALVLSLILTAVTLAQAAQQPVAELPRTYIDTTYHRPSGSTLHVRNGQDLQATLDAAHPGDTVLLEAGATFTGNFALPPKTGDAWIYIESSAIEGKVPAGQRATAADASAMAKIQTSNSDSAISVLPGAGHYRLVGLEVTPAAGAARVYSLVNIDFVTSKVEAKVRSLAKRVAPGLAPTDVFPQNITIDRCYLHGSDTQDVREGVAANGIAVAIIDSSISDIHDSTMDSQAILSYRTPGPMKIVNNFLSATTEDVMFGGAGDSSNPYIPSDIEIRGNHFFKPMAWDAPGITLPPHNKWVAKNNLELKSAQRVIVSGNVMENSWMSGQMGSSVLLTIRTSQSGNTAVVDDITIESNVLKNVISGFATLATDDTCGAKYGYPNCTNPGEEKRVRIADNLILFANPKGPGGTRNWGLALLPEMSDLVFEHNTLISFPGTMCDQSIFFESEQSWKWPPPQSYTHNIWILDNVLCRPPTGDWGGQGTAGLSYYMGNPPPLDKRFFGNVMSIPYDYVPQTFPPKNSLQTKVTFANATAGNWQLASPKWTQTTDGALAGVDMTALKAAIEGTGSGSGDKKPDSQPAPASAAH